MSSSSRQERPTVLPINAAPQIGENSHDSKQTAVYYIKFPRSAAGVAQTVIFYILTPCRIISLFHRKVETTMSCVS